MAGIRWFPHDIDAFGDSSIGMLVSRYGFEGYGHYWLLVEQCHEDGPLWDLSDDDVRMAVASRHGWDDGELCSYINACVKFGLFDRKQWRKHVLTSNRICSNCERYQRQIEGGKRGAEARYGHPCR